MSFCMSFDWSGLKSVGISSVFSVRIWSEVSTDLRWNFEKCEFGVSKQQSNDHIEIFDSM